jgi:hypothetical protein
VRNMDPGAATATAADGLTAAAAAFNAAWLAAYWLGPGQRRRLSALTLFALNAGIAVQAVFAQALYTAHRLDADVAPFFATGPWVAARALLLAATLMLSLLILRRSPQ